MENAEIETPTEGKRKSRIIWEKWGGMHAWTLDEAVALSLNIVPGSLSKLEEKKSKKYRVFSARLLLASRQKVGVIKLVENLNDNGKSKGAMMVDPSSFVAFAQSRKRWQKSFSKEFLEIGHSREVNNQGAELDEGSQKEIKPPVDFVAALIKLLIECACREQKREISFDVTRMPGIKLDFFAIACVYNKNIFAGYTYNTFDTYIKGLCGFVGGSKESDYYEVLFSDLKPKLGWGKKKNKHA